MILDKTGYNPIPRVAPVIILPHPPLLPGSTSPTDSVLYMWGRNNRGQLGIGNLTQMDRPEARPVGFLVSPVLVFFFLPRCNPQAVSQQHSLSEQ